MKRTLLYATLSLVTAILTFIAADAQTLYTFPTLSITGGTLRCRLGIGSSLIQAGVF